MPVRDQDRPPSSTHPRRRPGTRAAEPAQPRQMQPRGAVPTAVAASLARQNRALIGSWSSSPWGQTGQASAEASRAAAATPPPVTYEVGNALVAMVPSP